MHYSEFDAKIDQIADDIEYNRILPAVRKVEQMVDAVYQKERIEVAIKGELFARHGVECDKFWVRLLVGYDLAAYADRERESRGKVKV